MATPFETFVNTELPLRTGIMVSPTAGNYPRFTGVGRLVEERTPAQVRADVGAAPANATNNDRLLGSGNTGAGNPYAEIVLGTNLSMSGTTLNATGGGTPSFVSMAKWLDF